MSSIPDQQPNIVLLCECKASFDIIVSSNSDGVLDIVSYSTLTITLVDNGIAAVVGKERLHNTRRALLME